MQALLKNGAATTLQALPAPAKHGGGLGQQRRGSRVEISATTQLPSRAQAGRQLAMSGSKERGWAVAKSALILHQKW